MDDLAKLTVIELKALAYDTFAGIETSQLKLRQINDEIAKKSRELKDSQ